MLQAVSVASLYYFIYQYKQIKSSIFEIYVLIDVEFQCQWRGCGRTKKSVPPFPSVQRLARHVKEVHILKSNGRIIPPSERSKYDVKMLYKKSTFLNL